MSRDVELGDALRQGDPGGVSKAAAQETLEALQRPVIHLEPVLTLTVTGNATKGFAMDITSDLSEEMVGAILQQAADEVLGRNDRAAGAWGR